MRPGALATNLKTPPKRCAQIGITSELISKGKYAEIFSARSFTAAEDAYFGKGAMAVSLILCGAHPAAAVQVW